MKNIRALGEEGKEVPARVKQELAEVTTWLDDLATAKKAAKSKKKTHRKALDNAQAGTLSSLLLWRS